MINKQISPEKALAKAQNICAKQEKCKADIRKKLYEWKTPAEDIENILDKLVDDKFIDENRYTGYFVRDRYKLNKWGRIKIVYSLKQKQIAQSIIDKAISTINEDEYEEILHEELKKKLRSLKNEEKHKLKEKLLRFSTGRGYETELSLTQISRLLNDSGLR
jgi:regulatory protein